MNIMNIISVVILAFSITLLGNAFKFDLRVTLIKGLTSCLFAIEAEEFFIICQRLLTLLLYKLHLMLTQGILRCKITLNNWSSSQNLFSSFITQILCSDWKLWEMSAFRTKLCLFSGVWEEPAGLKGHFTSFLHC